MNTDRFLHIGEVYRYYDKSRNLDFTITITSIRLGYVHGRTKYNKPIKAELLKVKPYLFDSRGYNYEGYDIYGRDIRGFDRFGYNINGVNKDGYDSNGNKVSKIGAYEGSCYAGTETTNQKICISQH